MANLTITVDETTLKRARIKALEQGTSVNKLLRQYLDSYVDVVEDRERQLRALRHAFEVADKAGWRSGGITWTREDLYKRGESRS